MAKKKGKNKKASISLGRRIWRYTYRTFIALWLLSIVHVVVLKYAPIYFTPLMVLRSCQSLFNGKIPRNDKTWVPIEQISHNLVVACIASEDNLFMKHNGFSERAIRQAIAERKEGKRMRGGSTISQQTAKNVFTFCFFHVNMYLVNIGHYVGFSDFLSSISRNSGCALYILTMHYPKPTFYLLVPYIQAA